MPTIHQIFGDNPAEYPLTACRGVGFLLLRAVCSGNGFRRQRRPCLVADQLLGNSVGAIESAAHAITAISLDRVAALGTFVSLAWYNSLPLGGLPWGFGSLA